MNRNQQIIRTSVVGIAANLFLAAFKAVAGWVGRFGGHRHGRCQ